MDKTKEYQAAYSQAYAATLRHYTRLAAMKNIMAELDHEDTSSRDQPGELDEQPVIWSSKDKRYMPNVRQAKAIARKAADNVLRGIR